MPPILGAIAAISASSALGGALVNLAVGLALNAVAGVLFGKKPEETSTATGFSSEARGRQQTFRSSVAARRIIYGRVKVSGPLIFASSTGATNEFLHMVIPLATHEVEAIEDVFFDDENASLSKFSGVVRIERFLGTDTQAASGDLVSEVAEWTNDHRGKGVAYIYVRLTYDQDVFPKGAPSNISAIVRGKKTLDTRTAMTVYNENPALMVNDYIRATFGLEASASQVDTSSFNAGANVCEERQAVNPRNIKFKVANLGINTFFQDGVELDFRTGDGVRVSTDVALPTPLVAGVTYFFIEYLFDPNVEQNTFRLATTYGNAIAGTVITITGSGSGTQTVTMFDQVRYNANGSFELDKVPLSVLEEMVTSIAGVTPFSQGKYFIKPGAASASVASFNEDVLRDGIKVQPAPPKRDVFNAMRGTFVDPSKFWQLTDFPSITNALYESEDGGQRIWREIELPYTNSPTRAQRIASIHLNKSRQGITVEMPCNFQATKVAIWDVIQLTNTILGWNNKEFRVMGWTLAEQGGIDLNLQEEASSVYDWVAGDSTDVDPAPNTNLPSATAVLPPGEPVVTEELYVTLAGNGVKSRADVSWTAPADAFVVQYEAQYKLSADADFLQIGIFSGSVTRTQVQDLAAGTYDFRVRAINSFGVRSAFATTQVELLGLTAPPSDIAGFSMNTINNQAHLSWTQAPDLDVKIGGVIRVRYSKDTAGATWSGSIDLAEDMPGITTHFVTPVLTGTYLIKAVDSTGTESVSAAAISTNIADITKMNIVATLTENPTFSGTKTGMIVVSNDLLLDSTTLFDSVAGLFDDAMGNFDAVGGIGLIGTYRFSAPIDAGKVTTCRATSAMKVLMFNAAITFDETAGLFDDHTGMFDGDDVTGIGVKLFVRTTDDDPGGTPTWSDFRQFFVGDYTARGFDFELRVNSTNESLNIDISELSVSVDVPDITDQGTALTSGAGVITINYNKTFIITEPVIGVTIQDATTNDYVFLTNVTNISFQVGVKTNNSQFAARTIDWIAKGY